MQPWIVCGVLLAVLACQVSARRGSISQGLYQDDTSDDVVINVEAELEGATEEVKEAVKRNPCYRKKCHRGETCSLNDDLEAVCVCVTSDMCTKFRRKEDRHKVCSSKNDTYPSDCDLDRDHCLCKHNREGCTRVGAKKIQLEYYGVCKEAIKCTDADMVQFPKRMRDWFFVVMEFLENKHSLNEYESLLEEARLDANHSIAVMWKFCDLDKDPQDRHVTRRELQYTVRTLRALEHCLVPFLDDCDADDNRQITLNEWATCLGVDHAHVSDRCVKIKRKKDKKKN